MLWIEPCTVLCIASLGGVMGGCLMAIAQRSSNKYNMQMLEKQWESDYTYFRDRLEKTEHKLFTLTVEKPVRRHVNKYYNKGYKRPRHFAQRG